jgi:hypothetical protein
VIKQKNENKPYTLRIIDSHIRNGRGVFSAFSNVGGGELTLQGVGVENVEIPHLVKMETTLTDGSTTLRDILVSKSSMDDIIVVTTTEGGTGTANMDADGVAIVDMTRMKTIFRIVGNQSSLMLQNFAVMDNSNFALPAGAADNDLSLPWTGLEITEGATAYVSNAIIDGKMRMR